MSDGCNGGAAETPMSDQLWKGAKRDLLVQAEGGPADQCIWEHSERVARIADQLLSIPEVKDRAVDRQALTAAALYHDAGWVLQFRSKEIPQRDLLLKPTSDIQREMAADWLLEQLTATLSPGVLQQAARIIRGMNNRRTDMFEARVLADAENLDEIGPHYLCLLVRKMCAEGKTLADVIITWQRQAEYQYWPARIKDGLHFESSRQIARRRLEKLSRIFEDLREVVFCEDLKDITGCADSDAKPAANR
jgi:HD superfamily phosphodiesterase